MSAPSPPASSQNIQRTVAILQKILEHHEKLASKKNGRSFLGPDVEQQLSQVQAMLDKLQSPLFSSLVEVHSKYKHALAKPQHAQERPRSTALEFSTQPESLPQFCQRYGISDIAAGDKSLLKKQTSESNHPMPRKKKLAAVKTSGVSTSGFISGSGHLIPVARRESPKAVSLADLAKQPVHREEREMKDLDDRVDTGMVTSSTESSLSSVSTEVASHHRSTHLGQGVEAVVEKSKPPEKLGTSLSDLVIINQHTEKKKEKAPSKDRTGNPPSNTETLQMMVLTNSLALEEHEQQQTTNAIDTEKTHDEVLEDRQSKEVLDNVLEERQSEEALSSSVDKKSCQHDEVLEDRQSEEVLSVNKKPCQYDEVQEDRRSEEVFSLSVDKKPCQHDEVLEERQSEEVLSSPSVESNDENKTLESTNIVESTSLPQQLDEAAESRNERDGALLNLGQVQEVMASEVTRDESPAPEDDSPVSYLSVSMNQEDFGETLSSIAEEDDNVSRDSLDIVLGRKDDEIKEKSLEENLPQPSTLESSTISDSVDTTTENRGNNSEEEDTAIDDHITQETEGDASPNTTGGSRRNSRQTGTEATDGAECEVQDDNRPSATKNPKDILFFMRDKKSLTELSEAIKRTDNSPRTVTLSLGGPTVGGAKRAGLELIGLSSTGVFIDAIIPDGVAHCNGELRKGDQVMKINSETTEGKASFEVDLILREAPTGQDITMEVQYNPIGYSECQKAM